MSAAAVVPFVIDGDALVAKAKKILAENRSITQAEQQEFRDGLYRLMERGENLAHDTLKLVCDEVERRSEERTRSAIIASSTSAIAARVEHGRNKPKRWAALAPLTRVAFRMNDGTDLGRALATFAAILEAESSESTASRLPPANFEPDGRW